MNAAWVQAVICFTFLAVIALAGTLERWQHHRRRHAANQRIEAAIRRGYDQLDGYLAARAEFDQWYRQRGDRP